MGSVRERFGKHVAEAVVGKKRKSRSFKTKKEAWAWITLTEQSMQGGAPNATFGDLLDEYAAKVTPNKRSAAAELRRIDAIKKDPIAKVQLSHFDAPDVSEWRDRRLAKTSAATVLRDWNLLNHACNVALNEWHWLRHNPMRAVKRPAPPPARQRVMSDDEIERMILVTGYGMDSKYAQVGSIMLLALETAMRAGEICALEWQHVHSGHAHVPLTKNGVARDVPLSERASELIEEQKPHMDVRGGKVYSTTPKQLDAIWRKLRARANIKDLHFHDTRRTALTRMAKIFDVMDLAKISGHRDIRILQNVYYAPTVQSLTDKLRAGH